MAEIFCLSLIEIGLINLPKYDKDQSSPHVAIHSGSPVHNIATKTCARAAGIIIAVVTIVVIICCVGCMHGP